MKLVATIKSLTSSHKNYLDVVMQNIFASFGSTLSSTV